MSVNSRVVLRSIPSSFNFFKPSTSSGKFFTGLQRARANLPDPSARLSRIFRVAVAAIEASKPASANFPNNARVSSIVKLNDLATGPTIGKAVARYENDKALREVATAMADT